MSLSARRQILRAAPADSLLVCQRTTVAPFPSGAAGLGLLDNLGALERMDLVPLMQNRRVVFVEDRDDRRMIELFTKKKLGDQKAEQVLRSWTFLYTYQEPVMAKVRDKARQVRDLLQDQGLASLGSSAPVTFLAVGDRDYRTDNEIRKAVREHKLDGIDLVIWKRNEIENHLWDMSALRAAVRAEVQPRNRGSELQSLLHSMQEAVEAEVAALRTSAEDGMATHLHQGDRRLEYQTVAQHSRDFFNQHWGDGMGWCDAKRVLAALRSWAQKKKLRAQVFSESNIIAHMDNLPADVERLVQRLRKGATGGSVRRKRGNNP